MREPQFTDEREHARKLLGKRYRWWQDALAERQLRLGDDSVAPPSFAFTSIRSLAFARSTNPHLAKIPRDRRAVFLDECRYLSIDRPSRKRLGGIVHTANEPGTMASSILVSWTANPFSISYTSSAWRITSLS